MIKEYYFNKEFLKLLKLDDNKSYTLEYIFFKMIKDKIINKKVERRGRYGISKSYYFDNNFRTKLEIVRKKYNIGRRPIRRKFKSSYTRNLLWCFVNDEDRSKFDFKINITSNDFNYIKVLEI